MVKKVNTCCGPDNKPSGRPVKQVCLTKYKDHIYRQREVVVKIRMKESIDLQIRSNPDIVTTSCRCRHRYPLPLKSYLLETYRVNRGLDRKSKEQGKQMLRQSYMQ